MNEVANHYDILIDENNDPVHDPKPLKDYMDKWDGQAFIDEMKLNKSKNVLEIGVGTGRLAIRVAPHCKDFIGIDISEKTVERAIENLKAHSNSTIICGDIAEHIFDKKFDVIYSSLTFMHIKDKQAIINKVANLLNAEGKFLLSIDKNQDDFIDIGSSKIAVFPNTSENIKHCIKSSGLKLICEYETEFATIFSAIKQ